MRLFKMLGLAAIAAVAMMAFVGVGSASAGISTLCTVAETPCAKENQYAAGTQVETKLKTEGDVQQKAVLKLNADERVECQASQITGETKTQKGDPFEAQIKNAEWTECKGIAPAVEVQCTVTAVQLPWQALLQEEHVAKGQGNGSLTVQEHPGNGQPGATVECGFLGAFLDCVFKVKEEAGKKAVLQVTGGNPAQAEANQVQLKQEETAEQNNCKAGLPQGFWDAKYEVKAINGNMNQRNAFLEEPVQP